jgi:Family of unknown function (DUF6483)
MINKDYLLRMAEKVGRALATIIGLRKYNKDEEALIYIDDILLKTVGLTSRFLNALSEEMLVKTISPLGTLNVEACLWIASLLKAEGEIYESQDNAQASYHRYHKALYLFLTLILHEPVADDSDMYSEVDTLINRLEDYELPMPTKNLLFAYYEQSGDYARAEDTLFDLLETDGEARQISSLRERGQAFYTRLRAKSDADLQNGNFSREEVEEGIVQLDLDHA